MMNCSVLLLPLLPGCITGAVILIFVPAQHASAQGRQVVATRMSCHQLRAHAGEQHRGRDVCGGALIVHAIYDCIARMEAHGCCLPATARRTLSCHHGKITVNSVCACVCHNRITGPDFDLKALVCARHTTVPRRRSCIETLELLHELRTRAQHRTLCYRT